VDKATRRRLRGALLAALAGAGLAWMPAAAADAYPTRPIRLVVPFPAGGTADMIGRLVAQHMSESLGQSVVVENRAGAGGSIAAANVAAAAPDGYTLLQGTIGTHGINPSLYKNLSFDAKKDFEPIARISAGTNVLVVNPAVPVKTVKELIALAKKEPGRLMMGSSGNGSSIHMSGEMFQYMTGTRFTHVPYRGGAAALTDLLGGRVQLMFDNAPTALPHIAKGALRPLAVTSSHRLAALPDVPTMIEAGVPDYAVSSWSGIFAPAGTPKAIVLKLNQAVNNALKNDKLRARYAEAGIDIDIMSAPDFTAFVHQEMARWSTIVKASGAQPD
jgi:tripartite-type tricarboxylate transporter receptor subunit TctC